MQAKASQQNNHFDTMYCVYECLNNLKQFLINAHYFKLEFSKPLSLTIVRNFALQSDWIANILNQTKSP